MNYKTVILNIICLSSFLLGQFPVQLNPDDMTEPINFTAGSDTEFLLTITASTNTNWSQAESESATLMVIVDGELTD